MSLLPVLGIEILGYYFIKVKQVFVKERIE
jgi:hypothetical protein